MPSAVRLREDYSAKELRGACAPVEGRQPEAAASVAGGGPGRDGPRREQPRSAAWIGRPCATGCISFNASGPQGLIDNWTEGPKPRLSGAATGSVRADRRGWSGS